MRILQTETILTSLRAYELTSLRAYESPSLCLLRTFIHFANWQRCWFFSLVFELLHSKSCFSFEKTNRYYPIISNQNL